MKNGTELFMNMQYEIFVGTFYAEGSIENFLREIDDLDVTVVTSKSSNEEWNKYSGEQITRFGILSKIFQTMKLEENMKDVCEIGKYLQKLGKEMEEFDYKKMEKEKEKKRIFHRKNKKEE